MITPQIRSYTKSKYKTSRDGELPTEPTTRWYSQETHRTAVLDGSCCTLDLTNLKASDLSASEGVYAAPGALRGSETLHAVFNVINFVAVDYF